MSSSRKNSIQSKVEAEFANEIARIHTRFDKGITRYRKRLDECKAFLKSNKTRKNSSSFTNRLSSFRSNVSKCQAMITKIAELEEERLDKLAEQEYLINRKVKAELQKYHMNVKMQNFGKSLQSR
jgi:hypothetical protein